MDTTWAESASHAWREAGLELDRPDFVPSVFVPERGAHHHPGSTSSEEFFQTLPKEAMRLRPVELDDPPRMTTTPAAGVAPRRDGAMWCLLQGIGSSVRAISAQASLAVNSGGNAAAPVSKAEHSARRSASRRDRRSEAFPRGPRVRNPILPPRVAANWDGQKRVRTLFPVAAMMRPRSPALEDRS